MAFGMPDDDVADTPAGEAGPDSASSMRASEGSSSTPSRSPDAGRAPAKPLCVGEESAAIWGAPGAPLAESIDASGTNCEVEAPGAAFHSMSALSPLADRCGRAAGPAPPSRNPSSPSLAPNSSMASGVRSVW
jgi:hypothetical protein